MRWMVVQALASLVVMVSACTPLQSDKPAPTEYVLEVPGQALDAEALERLPRPLTLQRPMLPAGLEGTRIRVRRPGNRLDHIADTRWAGPLPELVQQALEDALSARAEDGPGADDREGDTRHALRLRLRAFYPVYVEDSAERPELRVALTAELVEQASGEVVARAAARRAETVADRVPAIVKGLGRLLGQAVSEATSELVSERR